MEKAFKGIACPLMGPVGEIILLVDSLTQSSELDEDIKIIA